MSDEDMIDLLKKIYIGCRILISLEDVFGKLFEIEGCYMGNLEQHGYYSVGGGWGLYSIQKYMPEMTEIMCYQFEFKRKRRSQTSIYKIGYEVKSIKVI